MLSEMCSICEQGRKTHWILEVVIWIRTNSPWWRPALSEFSG